MPLHTGFRSLTTGSCRWSLPLITVIFAVDAAPRLTPAGDHSTEESVGMPSSR